MDNKKRVVVILFVLAIVFSVGSVLISMDVIQGFGGNDVGRPAGSADVALFVEERPELSNGEDLNG